MNLSQYLELQTEWLQEHRHPKTVNETRVAVETFCKWLRSDPEIDDITLKMLDEFHAAERTPRRRQLRSNLAGLLKRYDQRAFTRSRSLSIYSRDILAVLAEPVEEKAKSFLQFACLYTSRRVMSPNYANTLRKRAAALQRFAHKTAIAEVLNEATVNRFLESIEGTGLSESGGRIFCRCGALRRTTI